MLVFYIYLYHYKMYKNVNILNRMLNIDLKSHMDKMVDSFYLTHFIEFYLVNFQINKLKIYLFFIQKKNYFG